MQIDRQQILEFLQQQGDRTRTEQAEQRLPDQVDTHQHSALLRQLGLDPQQLASVVGGGPGGMPGGS